MRLSLASRPHAAAILILALSLTLAGCGGDDSSDEASAASSLDTPPTTTPAPPAAAPTPPPPPPPTASDPLTLSASNLDAVATLSLGWFEGALRLAEGGASYLPATIRMGVTTRRDACASGEVEVEFTDTDASRRISSGDVLRLDFRDCELLTQRVRARGELRLTLRAPPTGLAGDEVGYTYEVSSPSGMRLSRTDQPSFEYVGGFEATQVSSPAKLRWSIRASGSADLNVRTIDAGTSQQTSEQLSGFAASRVVDYDLARIATELSGTVRSEKLAGQIIVRTPAPLGGHLNTYAHEGRIEIDGAASARATIAANLAANSASAAVSLDANGDGTAEIRDRPIAWTSFTDGLLWAEPRFDRYALAIEAYDPNAPARLIGVRALDQAATVPVFGPLVLQFSRRIDAADGVSYAFGTGPGAIATTLDRHGGRLLLTPQSQLTHGASYSLIATGFLRDERGNLVRAPNTGVTANDNLRPMITGNPWLASPGQSFTLRGTQSLSASGGMVVAYRWRQTGGSAATMITPNAASTTVTPVMPPLASGELLSFELEITNAAGERARTTDRVHVLTGNRNATTVAILRAAPAAGGASPRPLIMSSAARNFAPDVHPGVGTAIGPYGVVYAPATTEELQANLPQTELRFRGLNQLLGLLPGTYAPAGDMTEHHGTTSGYYARIVEGPGRTLEIGGGTFTILEAEQASDGTPLRLAIDFATTDTSRPIVRGALRYRSSIAVPADLIDP